MKHKEESVPLDDPRYSDYSDDDDGFPFLAFCIFLIVGCLVIEFVISIPARFFRWAEKVKKLFVPIVRE